MFKMYTFLLSCRKANCRLFSTHDDYSMMSKFPKEKISVVTILRNPIDRIFSTYEFSVEVAARFLIHPNLTSVARMAKRVRGKTSGVSTLDIWPWKYLVPWMREDLFARVSSETSVVMFFTIQILAIFWVGGFCSNSWSIGKSLWLKINDAIGFPWFWSNLILSVVSSPLPARTYSIFLHEDFFFHFLPLS